jgi:hypothetical protein
MKKLAIPVLCTLIGCAAGVAAPALTAQTFGGPAAGVGTWEQFCEDSVMADGQQDESRMRRWGELGFRLVAAFPSQTREADWVTACYSRPTHAATAW